MQMIDVYDFDGTLYRGDSTLDYVLFILFRRPLRLFLIPAILLFAVMYIFERSLTNFKGRLFHLLSKAADLNEEGKEFWKREKTLQKLNQWFNERPRDIPIVIASASVDCELSYAPPVQSADCLICTRLDEFGRVIGRNCKRGEKIERIRERYGNVCIRAMYTDNIRADGPLLELAREKYLVEKNGLLRRLS